MIKRPYLRRLHDLCLEVLIVEVNGNDLCLLLWANAFPLPKYLCRASNLAAVGINYNVFNLLPSQNERMLGNAGS